jgi:hypothetical protein
MPLVGLFIHTIVTFYRQLECLHEEITEILNNFIFTRPVRCIISVNTYLSIGL